MGRLYRINCMAMVSSMLVVTLASCAGSPRPAVDRLSTSSLPVKSSNDPGRPVSADAALPSSFTMQAAIRRAIDYQPSIIQAAGQVSQQGAAIKDAQSGYFPSVGGGLNLGKDTSLGSGLEPAANVTASQMLYDFGKVSNRIASETATQDMRRADFLAAVDDVIKQTAEAAIETLRNQSLAVVAADQIRDTESILKLVKARTDRGASTKSDQLQAEARVQAAQSTALEIGSQSQRWQGTLASLLGGSGRIDLAATVPSGLPTACSQAEPNWDNVPSIQAALSKKKEAEASLRLTRSDSWPTLALQAGGNTDLLDGLALHPTYTIGLQLTGKLYNGKSYAAKQDEGKFAVQSADAGIAVSRTDAIRSWRESGSQVSGMATLLSSLASRQGLMRETRDLYQRQFLDLGTRTLLDVLNADQELHAARFDAINTRFDLYKLNIGCGYAAGRLRDIFGLDKKPGMASTVVAASDGTAEMKIEMAVELPPQQLLPKTAVAELGAHLNDIGTAATQSAYVDPAVHSQAVSETVLGALDDAVRFHDVALRGPHETAEVE